MPAACAPPGARSARIAANDLLEVAVLARDQAVAELEEVAPAHAELPAPGGGGDAGPLGGAPLPRHPVHPVRELHVGQDLEQPLERRADGRLALESLPPRIRPLGDVEDPVVGKAV